MAEKFIPEPEEKQTTAAIDAGKRIGELEAPKFMEIRGVPFATMPTFQKIEMLYDLMERPIRLATVRKFRRAASLCAYVYDFKDENTRLYGDQKTLTVIAVLDDHQAPSDEPAIQQPLPRWNAHQAKLELLYSEEWLAWKAIHKRDQGHVEFVEFLQERLSTIAKPDASEILASIRTFAAHRSAHFEQVLPAEGGNLSISFSEEVKGATRSGSADMPTRLTLSLRVFEGQTRTDLLTLEAIIRWRLSREGELTFSVALLEADLVAEAAFNSVLDEITDTVDLPVLI